ncbi:MAG: adenosylhomocysteinase [Bryobacteraceae bacterium]|nr:adenosylhomocysteinase [Bryobacteraceae bacterium]
MDRVATVAVPCDIRDLTLADAGRRKIDWASVTMPVLRMVRKQFIKTQPFADLRVSASLPATPETAAFLMTLRDGGASPVLCGCDPDATQDDVSASLVRDYHIPVFALSGETSQEMLGHRTAVLALEPHLIVDSAAELGEQAMSGYTPGDSGSRIFGTVFDNPGGAVRYRAIARQNGLPVPVIDASDTKTRSLFESRYGTGQSTLDTIVRITGLLLAGTNIVVAGYGASGQGIAAKARGSGANVVITETDPLPALEAVMDGYRVMPISEAARFGDIFITATGNRSVVGRDVFERLKDGALICNAGSSSAEIDIAQLGKVAASHRGVREFVEEYKLKDGRRICVLADGRTINLIAGAGQPASVLDITFATLALAAEYLVQNRTSLSNAIHSMPESLDRQVARIKLDSMCVSTDKLTIEQEQYLGRSEN